MFEGINALRARLYFNNIGYGQEFLPNCYRILPCSDFENQYMNIKTGEVFDFEELLHSDLREEILNSNIDIIDFVENYIHDIRHIAEYDCNIEQAILETLHNKLIYDVAKRYGVTRNREEL